MGQANYRESFQIQKINHQRSSTLKSSRISKSTKLIRVKCTNIIKELLIEDISLTCGWLLSEVIRMFPSINPIVGLKSLERADVIDVWLQEFDRSLNILKHGMILTPIIGQSIPSALSLAWFDPISMIGKGGFSQVYLIRKKDNGYLYALKVMQKSHIIQQNKVKQILSECSILRRLSHPFIIDLRWAFQTVI